jgi:predicted flap endonuclease-1-like 5' DNA nuclease
MIALFVQTLLLMGAAYFVGAAVACLIRRSLHTGARLQPAAAHPVEPLPEMMQRAGGPARFARSSESEARPAPKPVAQPASQSVVPATPITVPSAQAPPTPPQDLKRIRLIDAEAEAGLNKLSVHRYEQIAAWMQPDIRRISDALGLGDRINRENWIEQAQVLAKGGVTHYAERVARGEVAKAVPTPDEGEPRTMAAAAASPPIPVIPRASTGGAAAVAVEVAMSAPAPAMPPTPPVAPASSPDVSERAAFAAPRGENPAPTRQAAPAPTPEPAVPVRPAAPAARDNLQRISDIDTEAEQVLIAQGVSRYSQIAHWSPAEVQRFDRQLGASGRIGRENWIEQAQILSRGGDTAFSRDYDRRARGEAGPLRPAKLADAIRENTGKGSSDAARPAKTDLGALRSVRSAAYQNPEPGPEAAQRAAAQSKVLRSAALDDLKRIRGVGVLIEKKLNQMGVVAYEQIANWTAEDVDRVSQSLDFKGRIERENWVEQARILASGGATEFSRRVDRGEVETSRYRP